ncbi:MAG: arginyltransferase [Gammaproteobacteria bacterium]|nr:arginyltransferase [Gammaproteobacteria bacterium]
MTSSQVRLLMGTQHACSYLPSREARSVFIDPHFRLDPGRYGALLEMGFRRSGAYVYRPACLACRECRPVRVPVASFAPTRAQRRCEKRNADLVVEQGERLEDEHYALYRRYLRQRHPDGGMDPEDRSAFHSFLECPWGEAQVWSFRAAGRLVAAAIVDRVPHGLSAVYTFYETAEGARSLGTYAVLAQIRQARQWGLPHLYLGYWVPRSEKMDYKRNFQPLEELTPGGWQEVVAAG